jgi:5-methylthioribose kinase
VVAIWDGFAQRFLALWHDAAAHKGELFKRDAYPGADERAASQQAFLQQLLVDTLGFAGCKMIRRVVGIAHVEDLEAIADADVRAACEKRALETARELVVNAGAYPSIRDVVALARRSAGGQ